MKRKRRSGEVICRCGAYPFPHRMMGGACDGGAFVQAVFDNGLWGVCRGCNLLVERDGVMVCQALDGLEPLRNCPELDEYIQFEGIQLYGVNKPPPKKMGWRR